MVTVYDLQPSTELTSTIQFCVTESLEPCITFDIGNLLSPTKSIHDKCEAAEKYSNIFKHVSPPKTLPTTYSHECTVAWIKKYPWLLYSTKLDGIFCGPCAITLPVHSRDDKGILVNKPYNNWVKMSQTLSSHSKLIYHRDCVQNADALKDAITNPSTSRIDIISDTRLQARIAQNKHILKQIVHAILFLGRQGLAFRRDNEDINSSTNPGNFFALLKYYAETDDILKAHLEKNATYLPQGRKMVSSLS